MLASGGGMEKLRAAEKVAKEKHACLYENAAVTATKSSGSTPAGNSRNFDAIVTRVWSGDQISVVEKEGGKERRIQLSSTRTPKNGLSAYVRQVYL
jgi:staphylococcal nuclease domain-containing protein 1